MTDYPISAELLNGVERIVVASVAITARALTEVAPELTLGQWRVLVLIDRPGGMAVGSIAQALGAKIAAVSRLIGRLHRRGLVEQRRADHDARIVLVSLTPAGEALRAKIVARRRADLVGTLGENEVGEAAAPVIDWLARALTEIESD